MHGLSPSNVEANVKGKILEALPDSGCFAGMLPISGAISCLGVPPAHSAPLDRDDRDVFALQGLGSLLDQWMTDFPDLGPLSMPKNGESRS